MGLFTTSHRTTKNTTSYSCLIAFFEKFKSKKPKIAVNHCIYWGLQGLEKS